MPYNPRIKATAVTLGSFVIWVREKSCCNKKVVPISYVFNKLKVVA